jgi:hypothetical protein
MAILATIGLHGKPCRPTPAPPGGRGATLFARALAFARRTEAFVLHDPASAEAACEPSGSWRGGDGPAGDDGMLSQDNRSLYASWDEPGGIWPSTVDEGLVRAFDLLGTLARLPRGAGLPAPGGRGRAAGAGRRVEWFRLPA